MPGQSTLGFDRPGRHCLGQARNTGWGIIVLGGGSGMLPAGLAAVTGNYPLWGFGTIRRGCEKATAEDTICRKQNVKGKRSKTI